MNYIPEQVILGLLEVPNEISLIIPITGCSLHCNGCHSPEMQNEKNGEELTEEKFISLLFNYKNKASCICFFSGEFKISHLITRAKNEGFKTALYSGFTNIKDIPFNILQNIDYLKLGEYNELKGGLQEKTTNQRIYKIDNGNYEDITQLFWRNKL